MEHDGQRAYIYEQLSGPGMWTEPAGMNITALAVGRKFDRIARTRSRQRRAASGGAYGFTVVCSLNLVVS